MSKLENVLDIKMAALFLQKHLMGRNPEVVQYAENELARLVDRFYDENRDVLIPDQYGMACRDYDYFLVLVETVLERRRAQEREEGITPA